MICNNCGNNIVEGDKFCRNCGMSLKGENNYDEELLRVYVGKNYDKFVSRKFNVYMLMYPNAYMLYRKSYKYFIILLVLPFVPLIGIMVYFVLTFILAFSFNEMYLNEARDAINGIKQRNLGISSDALKELVANKGGTNLVAAIMYSLIVICLSLLMLVAFYYVLWWLLRMPVSFWNVWI